VDRLGWEVLLAENLGELFGVLDRLDKDDDLVELQLVQKVYEFSDLILVFKHHVVLLESVQGQLALVFDEDFSLVLHEFAADQFDVGGQSGREHHDLLVVRGLRENLLDVTAHA
jgi:hypothetical protein